MYINDIRLGKRGDVLKSVQFHQNFLSSRHCHHQHYYLYNCMLSLNLQLFLYQYPTTTLFTCSFSHLLFNPNKYAFLHACIKVVQVKACMNACKQFIKPFYNERRMRSSNFFCMFILVNKLFRHNNMPLSVVCRYIKYLCTAYLLEWSIWYLQVIKKFHFISQ